jgi:hypothetical protein
MIIAEDLRRQLRYDPDLGEFWWIERRRKRRLGVQAGTVQRTGKSRQIVRIIWIDGQRQYAHRLAFLWMTGRWPAEIDHINGNTLDNRWANLREATRSENNMNRAPDPNRGASFHKPSGLWQAYIKKNGRQIALGYFKTAEEAHAAYLIAAKTLHGAFHRR